MQTSSTMRRRHAFTLVELLVAMALVIFIMAIMTEAFTAGLETFRKLKAIGDMNERMRSATAILRRDLTSYHFEGRRRVSDPNFWNFGAPREGFLKIYQGSPSVLEGRDASLIPSYASPPLNAPNG